MKGVLLGAFIIYLSLAPAFGQHPQPKNNDIIAIRQMMATQEKEWNKGNIDGFMKGYWDNDSLMFIGSSGPQYGYNATLARYKSKYPDAAHMGKLAFTILSIKKLSADYYFVIGKWALQRQAGDVNGSFTLLLKRINGKLMIVVDHSS